MLLLDWHVSVLSGTGPMRINYLQFLWHISQWTQHRAQSQWQTLGQHAVWSSSWVEFTFMTLSCCRHVMNGPPSRPWTNTMSALIGKLHTNCPTRLPRAGKPSNCRLWL